MKIMGSISRMRKRTERDRLGQKDTSQILSALIYSTCRRRSHHSRWKIWPTYRSRICRSFKSRGRVFWGQEPSGGGLQEIKISQQAPWPSSSNKICNNFNKTPSGNKVLKFQQLQSSRKSSQGCTQARRPTSWRPTLLWNPRLYLRWWSRTSGAHQVTIRNKLSDERAWWESSGLCWLLKN